MSRSACSIILSDSLLLLTRASRCSPVVQSVPSDPPFLKDKANTKAIRKCQSYENTKSVVFAKVHQGTVKITNVDHCRYLGVHIDRDLKWTEHINQLYKKCLIMLVFSIGLDKDCLINVSRVFILRLSSTFASWHRSLCKYKTYPFVKNHDSE